MSPIARLPVRALVSFLVAWPLIASAVLSESLHHRVRLEGRGTPTIILESGLGDTLDVWSTVQPLIASGCGQTLAYNSNT